MKTSICVGLMVLGLAAGCAAVEGVEVDGTGGTDNGGAGGGASTPPPQMPVFDDFGAGDEVPPVEQQGCEKVDFLYVIDNSPSMVDEQENLARSFAGFSRVLEQTLRSNDRQIMIVDTDGLAAEDVPDFSPAFGCDGVLGAGLRYGGGGGCFVDDPLPFLVQGRGNEAESFSCLARVGAEGNVESKPIEALLRATGALGTELETCNTGFMRDDAILVVTIITDEDDDDSLGEPRDWKQMLLAAKGGNEQAIVMLGLISDTHLQEALPGGPCDDTSGLDAPRLQRFAESFELGSVASVCSPDYSEFFEEAVQTIDTACEVFVPIVR